MAYYIKKKLILYLGIIARDDREIILNGLEHRDWSKVVRETDQTAQQGHGSRTWSLREGIRTNVMLYGIIQLYPYFIIQ